MGSSKRLNKRYVYMTHELLPRADCNRTTEVHVDALVRHIFSMFLLYACMHVTKNGICQVDGIGTLEFDDVRRKTNSSSNL